MMIIDHILTKIKLNENTLYSSKNIRSFLNYTLYKNTELIVNNMHLRLFLFATLMFVAYSKRPILNSQLAPDIAGIPVHQDGYNQTKNVPHISFDAYQNAEAATKKFVRKMLVDGLREQFNKFKESFTQFADDEGFVREGIVYCGAASPAGQNENPPALYKQNTGLLIENDGVGDSEAFNETNVCSSLNAKGLMEDHCDENSIVGSLSRLVRGLGLNIHHQDICDAVIDASESKIPDPVVFTTTLKKYPSTRYERACKSKHDDPTAGGRHFQRNAKCFGTKDTDCTGICTFFERENTCFSVESNSTSSAGDSDNNCDPATKGIAPLDWVNTVRRATSYGLTQLAVEATNYGYMTGCQAGHCNSLRSVLAALNGNTQINAFRDLGIQEAGDHWLNEISTIKGYLVDFAYQLSNFRDISMEIFPYIEDEEIVGCPMGETQFEHQLTGYDSEPLCYQSNLDSEKLNTMDKTGQSFSRMKCFCRNGQLGRYNDPNTDTVVLEPNKYNKVEQDDLYLATDDSFDCDNATLPVSAYTYCKQIQTWGEMPSWQQTLESLLPDATKSRIKIYKYTHAQDLAQKRQAFVDNVKNTLPTALDTSCGRIVNADSQTKADASKMKRSNRGGNCPPFPKLHEILYRLEFETGARDMGGYAYGNNSNTRMFRDMFCKDGSFSQNAFSFRQFAYKWDSAAVKNEATPKQETLVQNWFNTHSKNTDADPRYTRRFIVNGAGDLGDVEFCHPHWVYEIGGDVGRSDSNGVEFEDPYILLKQEVDEAVFNTKMAQAAKTQVREHNTLLWSFIESQLTENVPGTVVDHLGAAAGEHYMRIWVDEHS